MDSFDLYKSAPVDLVFTGRYEGAKVTINPDIAYGDYRAFQQGTQTIFEELDWLIEKKVIVSWNLKAGSKALPLKTGVGDQMPLPFIRALVVECVKAVQGLSLPLVSASTSSDGNT